MDGIFRKKKWNRFLNWLGLVSGIGLVGIFAFLMVVDKIRRAVQSGGNRVFRKFAKPRFSFA